MCIAYQKETEDTYWPYMSIIAEREMQMANTHSPSGNDKINK